MGKKQHSDLFGKKPTQADDRGWTELDRLRRSYASIERRILKGEYTEKDLSDLSYLSDEIIKREKEAREKWAKSFGS